MTAIRLHATCLIVGAHAILVRGPSGSGKSRLALSLIAEPPRLPLGGHVLVRLVSDDQTLLAPAGRCLVASAPAILAGLIEVRGQGIFRLPYEPAACISHVFELGSATRLPDPHQVSLGISGVALPLITIPAGAADPRLLVMAALGLLQAARND